MKAIPNKSFRNISKKDLINWAKRMKQIGNYKAVELRRWYKHTSLSQRIAMTEELLRLNDYFPTKSKDPIHFVSLSKALEQKHTKKD